jgi:Flp pilus assembly protein TadD
MSDPSTSFLPTSGHILGALVEDFRLRLPDGITRSAREYFAGRRSTIKDSTRASIIDAVAAALVDQRYVPDLGPLPEGVGTGAAIARAIDTAALVWDDLVGRVHSEGLTDVAIDVAARACLRLAAVDLALRCAAAMRLAEGRPATCDCDLCEVGDVVEPKWPHADGQRLMIHEIVAQTERGSLEEFADGLLGFAPSTVDGWVKKDDPSRPSEEAISALARALANLDLDEKDAQERWSFGLRWRTSLATVADRVAGLVGRTRAVDLGWGLERCHVAAAEFLRHSQVPEETFRERMLVLLVLGVRDPTSVHILNALTKRERDESWVATLREATRDWLRLVVGAVATEASSTRAAVALAADGFGHQRARATLEAVLAFGTPVLPSSPVAKSTAMALMAMEATNSGDIAAAVVYLQGAIAEDPDRPELHHDLGAHLGQLGRFDEGIAACRRALELRHGWATPLVQIGIMLPNAGRDGEALVHIEELSGTVAWSASLGHTLGIARMRARKFELAIEAFERVLREAPGHAFALDAAAHCYLMLRQWRRGRELAKRAHALGIHETYTWLEAGHYGENERGREP